METCNKCGLELNTAWFRVDSRFGILKRVCRMCDSLWRENHDENPEVKARKSAYSLAFKTKHHEINKTGLTDKEKFCPVCRETKDADEFHKNSKRRGGLSSQCKDCDRVSNRRTLAILKNQIYDLLGHCCKRCSF